MILYDGEIRGIITNLTLIPYASEKVGANPVLTVPSNQSFEFSSGAGGLSHSELAALIAAASATDVEDGALTIANNLVLLADPIPEGVHTITFSATDSDSNTSTGQTVLTITEAAGIVYGETITLPNIEVL
jgi:hypothetical protein